VRILHLLVQRSGNGSKAGGRQHGGEGGGDGAQIRPVDRLKRSAHLLHLLQHRNLLHLLLMMLLLLLQVMLLLLVVLLLLLLLQLMVLSCVCACGRCRLRRVSIVHQGFESFPHRLPLVVLLHVVLLILLSVVVTAALVPAVVRLQLVQTVVAVQHVVTLVLLATNVVQLLLLLLAAVGLAGRSQNVVEIARLVCREQESGRQAARQKFEKPGRAADGGSATGGVVPSGSSATAISPASPASSVLAVRARVSCAEQCRHARRADRRPSSLLCAAAGRTHRGRRLVCQSASAFLLVPLSFSSLLPMCGWSVCVLVTAVHCPALLSVWSALVCSLE
jgi:hypothetical protein